MDGDADTPSRDAEPLMRGSGAAKSYGSSASAGAAGGAAVAVQVHAGGQDGAAAADAPIPDDVDVPVVNSRSVPCFTCCHWKAISLVIAIYFFVTVIFCIPLFTQDALWWGAWCWYDNDSLLVNLSTILPIFGQGIMCCAYARFYHRNTLQAKKRGGRCGALHWQEREYLIVGPRELGLAVMYAVFSGGFLAPLLAPTLWMRKDFEHHDNNFPNSVPSWFGGSWTKSGFGYEDFSNTFVTYMQLFMMFIAWWHMRRYLSRMLRRVSWFADECEAISRHQVGAEPADTSNTWNCPVPVTRLAQQGCCQPQEDFNTNFVTGKRCLQNALSVFPLAPADLCHGDVRAAPAAGAAAGVVARHNNALPPPEGAAFRPAPRALTTAINNFEQSLSAFRALTEENNKTWSEIHAYLFVKFGVVAVTCITLAITATSELMQSSVAAYLRKQGDSTAAGTVSVLLWDVIFMIAIAGTMLDILNRVAQINDAMLRAVPALRHLIGRVDASELTVICDHIRTRAGDLECHLPSKLLQLWGIPWTNAAFVTQLGRVSTIATFVTGAYFHGLIPCDIERGGASCGAASNSSVTNATAQLH